MSTKFQIIDIGNDANKNNLKSLEQLERYFRKSQNSNKC
jgi:hypothetical protein